MTVTSLEKAPQLSRVCDAAPSFRRRREQTLIGKGFSYSSAPLAGTDPCFSTNVLGITSLKFSSAIGPLAGRDRSIGTEPPIDMIPGGPAQVQSSVGLDHHEEDVKMGTNGL